MHRVSAIHRSPSLLKRWILLLLCFVVARPAMAQLKTWDGLHSIDEIQVTFVYFVPKDATGLSDWKERLEYYAKRIETFHDREFAGQSKLRAVVPDEPFRSEQTIEDLRRGDANAIFFRTLGEVDQRLKFGAGDRTAFPILLVLSEINWRPLDDFFRVKPKESGGWEFEGNYNAGRHFPGAESGGARATYLADRGVGWGLVSGDGWRVPYSGTDCVVYHEGVGHTVGLPHNEPADGAVMSLGQYYGWINQSWLDPSQKKKLGWKPSVDARKTVRSDRDKADLFTKFTALASPTVPQPNEPVELQLTWPDTAKVKSVRVRLQTRLDGPWIDVPVSTKTEPLERITIGRFDRPTPVSYRVDVELESGEREELWGYFQVRSSADAFPVPTTASSSDARK